MVKSAVEQNKVITSAIACMGKNAPLKENKLSILSWKEKEDMRISDPNQENCGLRTLHSEAGHASLHVQASGKVTYYKKLLLNIELIVSIEHRRCSVQD